VYLLRGWVLLAVVAAGLVLSSCEGGDSSPDLQGAEDFHTYKLYYVGSSFHGLPLTDVVRGSGRGPHRDWSFIYGTCDPGPDEGCATPLAVTNSSTCVRYRALYGKRRPELTPFRGAVFADDGLGADGSAEVYTGRTTVVVYGQDRRNALQALRRVGSSAVDGRLPPPAKGTLGGKLPCQHPPSRTWP
jgi:hypothetical protein